MKKIVIVEDDPMLIEIYSIKFTNCGFEVLIAKDGVEALELIKKAKADIILLDLQMPKVDGFEVTQKLRTDKAYSSDLKIIIFSNLDKDSSIEKLKKCGHIDAFLVKTAFTPTEMVDEVNRILL